MPRTEQTNLVTTGSSGSTRPAQPSVVFGALVVNTSMVRFIFKDKTVIMKTILDHSTPSSSETAQRSLVDPLATAVHVQDLTDLLDVSQHGREFVHSLYTLSGAEALLKTTVAGANLISNTPTVAVTPPSHFKTQIDLEFPALKVLPLSLASMDFANITSTTGSKHMTLNMYTAKKRSASQAVDSRSVESSETRQKRRRKRSSKASASVQSNFSFARTSSSSSLGAGAGGGGPGGRTGFGQGLTRPSGLLPTSEEQMGREGGNHQAGGSSSNVQRPAHAGFLESKLLMGDVNVGRCLRREGSTDTKETSGPYETESNDSTANRVRGWLRDSDPSRHIGYTVTPPPSLPLTPTYSIEDKREPHCHELGENNDDSTSAKDFYQRKRSSLRAQTLHDAGWKVERVSVVTFQRMLKELLTRGGL